MISRTLLRTGVLTLGLAALSFAANVAGEFKGSWSSVDNPGTGALRLVVSKADSPDPKCELFYTNGGDAEIAAKSKSCKLDTTKFDASFEAESDGGAITIDLSGTENKGAVSGDYKVYGSGGEVVDTGTWKASKSE